jgi:hypothetical protein
MNIIFKKQIAEVYAAAACVQMLTQTEESQQDIYFKMSRILQKVSLKDCVNKSKFNDISNKPIVGYRERLCKLLEDTLHSFSSVKFDVQIEGKLMSFPSFSVLHQKNTTSFFQGHPVIITDITKDKITIYDPINEGPVSVLRMKLEPFVLSCFAIKY